MRRAATRVVLVLIGLAMLCLSATSGQGAVFKEYELKAAFLYHFTKFTEWPTNRFQNADAPFIIAMAGHSRSTVELEQIAQERKVQGRTVIIRTVKTLEAAHDAHVLFVSSSEDARLKEWLPAVPRSGLLSIGESESFARQGGIINFVLEGENIRFEINMGQADSAGVKISAQLQKLARIVRRK